MPAAVTRDRAPRLSASGYHQIGCPSSYARELEYYRFITDHDIPGIQSGPEANRGTTIHAILAACPVSLPDWGVEPFDVRARLQEVAELQSHKLGSYEAWVLADMVRKRDELINAVLDRHPAGRFSVDRLDVFLDERRVGIGFDRAGHLLDPQPADPKLWPESHTGLADVLVVAYGGGIATCGILDYKTAFGSYDSTDNRQLERLLATFSLEEKLAGRPVPQSGLVAIASEEDAGGALVMAEYNRSMIEERERWLLRTMQPAIVLASAYRDGPNTPEPAMQEKLNSAAKMGEHCKHCDGKICCGKFRGDAALLQHAMEHTHRDLIDDPKLRNPATVTPEDVTKALTLGTAITNIAKLYDRTLDEAAQIAEQLSAKGITLEGVEFKPGTKRVRLAVKDCRQVHSMLEPLVKEDYATFTAAMAESKLDPYALRTYVASRLGIPDNKVVGVINDMQPGNNPLEVYETARQIKVTADLSDIVTDLRQEVIASTAAATPSATAIPAPMESAPAPAPKRRRSRAKTEPAPLPAPAPEQCIEIAQIQPEASEVAQMASTGVSAAGWD